MHYRLYRPDDFAQLYAIEEQCFQPPLRFGRRYMQRLVDAATSATWIAEEDSMMAGFAIVEWASQPEDSAAYIQTLEVAPSQRQRGVGAELLHRLESSAQAAGAAEIWLHVDAQNDGAIHLYRASGYVMDGREEHYYARGRAAEIYIKSLSVVRGGEAL